MPPPRLLAFPEIVMKRSLVFAQIVSLHGKTSPGWFTCLLLVFSAVLLKCTELHTSDPAHRSRTPVAITSSHIPQSPPRTKNHPRARRHLRRGPRSNPFLGRRSMQAKRQPSGSSLRTLTEREARVFYIHVSSAGSCDTDSAIIETLSVSPAADLPPETEIDV